MPEHSDTIKTREEDNLELFENYLVSVLKKGVGEVDAEDKQLLIDLNRDVISLFDDDPDFQKKLENVLYRNQEKLTSQKFVLGEQNKRPTVSNWIKHFIKEEGTEMYGDVTLSGFLSNSPNVKRLNEKEVALVRALLVLYRNLKFFPKSMEGVSPEKWEIIPIREEGMENTDKKDTTKSRENKEKKTSTSTEPPSERGEGTEDSVSSDTALSPQEKGGSGGEKESVSSQEEEKKEETRLEKLKRIKDNYEEDSLERKAIEGEIKELENRD